MVSQAHLSENLSSVLQYVRNKSPLYRRKLAGFDTASIQTIDDIKRLPFTTRADLQELAPFGSICEGHRPEAYYESSGTTGSPVPGFPDLSADKATSFGRFLDRWMGLSDGHVKRALVSLAFEMNPTGIRFQMALPHAGVIVLPTGVRTTICPPEKVIEIISRLQPQAIFGRPFELLRYGDLLLRNGTPPSQTEVTKLFFLGEIMSAAKWERIRRLWDDADLYGHYGLTEVDSGLQSSGPGHYQEPDTPFLFTEIIDPISGHEVLPGAWGEIVFSVLRATHAPLLRYRTGDIGRRIIARNSTDKKPHIEIRGRFSDEHIIDGKSVFPIDLENIIFNHDEIGNEYLFIIEQDGSLRLILEQSFGASARLAACEKRIADHVYSALGVTAAVEVHPFGSIADKLGIPQKKSGRFTDLRGLSSDGRLRELNINVVDAHQLRTGTGEALSI